MGMVLLTLDVSVFIWSWVSCIGSLFFALIFTSFLNKQVALEYHIASLNMGMVGLTLNVSVFILSRVSFFKKCTESIKSMFALRFKCARWLLIHAICKSRAFISITEEQKRN